MRVCLEPGCPNLQPESRCAQHARHHQHRLTTTQRGYGATHTALRRKWKPKVDAGQVNCARCNRRIQAGTPWHLGHDDNDRTKYHGPEHVDCNLKAHKVRQARRRVGG